MPRVDLQTICVLSDCDRFIGLQDWLQRFQQDYPKGTARFTVVTWLVAGDDEQHMTPGASKVLPEGEKVRYIAIF